MYVNKQAAVQRGGVIVKNNLIPSRNRRRLKPKKRGKREIASSACVYFRNETLAYGIFFRETRTLLILAVLLSAA